MPGADTRLRTWLSLLLGLALTIVFFYMMAPFLVAFLLGAVIAIIANPIYQWCHKRMAPAPAAGLTTSALTLLILAPSGLLLFTATHRLLKLIGELKVTSQPFSFSGLAQNPVFRSAANWLSKYVDVDRDWMRDQVKDLLLTVGESLSKMLAASLAATPSFLLAFFVVIISTFFLLKDGEAFLHFLESLSPAPSNRSKELFSTFEKSCRGVVLSLLASALAQGILMLLFSAITGLKNPFLLGMITVVMGMVPIVGAAPVWIGAAIYLFLQGSSGYGVVMLFGGISISTVDNVIRPIVLKGHSQMHPLLALVSVFGAINLMGATGIFLGPIIAAVFVSFLKILSLEIRRSKEPVAPVTGLA